MQKALWLVDAFTDRPLCGNPAGVVPDASGLSSTTMQKVAAEVHASETAFVLPASDGVAADFQIRYFTPLQEVDLCGHATIGSICGLLVNGRLPEQTGTCRIETNVGVLSVRYGFDGETPWAEMGQAAPQFRGNAFAAETAANRLGIAVADIDETLPIGMSYTGLWDVFVPIRSRSVVSALKPDLAALADWNESLGAASTHVYARGGFEPGQDFHTRDFSPAVGVPEDPATGTATGALMSLLRCHRVVAAGDVRCFAQGYEIDRPSSIWARTDGSDDQFSVYVRGSAALSLSGVLYLGDDERLFHSGQGSEKRC